MEYAYKIEDKYRIIKLLGKGGTSEVFLAENISLNTYWALKRINKSKCILRNLYSEINILKKLNHPNLPVLYDVIDDKEYVYIVERYIEGKTLHEIINERHELCEKEVIRITKEICNILRYLHNLKPFPIIFRDLKPSNIIVSPNGNINLLDFGIAREYSSEKEKDTVLIGTKGYASPEQYGTAQTDQRSDIFSLGVTMFYMLTGMVPYEAKLGVNETHKYDLSISKKLEKVIEKCLKYNPQERFQNVDEIVNLLEKKRIRETKKIPFKRQIFKKITIGIINNNNFAFELAESSARLSDLKVSLINLNIFCNSVDVFYDIELKKEKNLNNIISFLGEPPCTFLSYKKNDLHIFTNNKSVLDNSILKFDDLKILLDEFDLNILNLNYNYLDTINFCDNYIYVGSGNIDTIKNYEKIKEYMFKNYGINKEKVKYVAYNYMKNLNPPVKDIKDYIGEDSFLGIINFSPQKEVLINYNDSYKKLMNRKLLKDYTSVLNFYNIV
jgi:serine/threonine protein kinase